MLKVILKDSCLSKQSVKPSPLPANPYPRRARTSPHKCSQVTCDVSYQGSTLTISLQGWKLHFPKHLSLCGPDFEAANERNFDTWREEEAMLSEVMAMTHYGFLPCLCSCPLLGHVTRSSGFSDPWVSPSFTYSSATGWSHQWLQPLFPPAFISQAPSTFM